eukprot:UN09606
MDIIISGLIYHRCEWVGTFRERTGIGGFTYRSVKSLRQPDGHILIHDDC